MDSYGPWHACSNTQTSLGFVKYNITAAGAVDREFVLSPVASKAVSFGNGLAQSPGIALDGSATTLNGNPVVGWGGVGWRPKANIIRENLGAPAGSTNPLDLTGVGV